MTPLTTLGHIPGKLLTYLHLLQAGVVYYMGTQECRGRTQACPKKGSNHLICYTGKSRHGLSVVLTGQVNVLHRCKEVCVAVLCPESHFLSKSLAKSVSE